MLIERCGVVFELVVVVIVSGVEIAAPADEDSLKDIGPVSKQATADNLCLWR